MKPTKLESEEQLYGHPYLVEWTLLDKVTFVSAANIYQILHVQIERLEFVVTRARPRQVEAPERLIIYLAKICLKKDTR